MEDTITKPVTTEKPKLYWAGSPGTCNFCSEPFGTHFVDGRTRMGWANMCLRCHKDNGEGLGIGRGQKYEFEKSTGKYFKVEG